MWRGSRLRIAGLLASFGDSARDFPFETDDVEFVSENANGSVHISDGPLDELIFT